MTKPSRLAFVGDVALHQEFPGTPQALGPALAEGVRSLVPEGTLLVANLEAPMTIVGQAFPGKCSLQSDPGWAQILRRAGVTAVSLANNHVMDSGPRGLEETLVALTEAGIQYAGAGRDLQEARRPAIVDLGNLRVAILCRSDVPVKSAVWAGDGVPGIAAADRESVLADVSALRDEVDFLVLCIHWGLEQYRLPTPEQRQFARLILNAGADVIIGHHPHVLQGFEYIDSKPVFYSLGNFIFPSFAWTSVDQQGSGFTENIDFGEDGNLGSVVLVSIDAADQIHLVGTRFQDGIPRRSNEAVAVLERRSRAISESGYGLRWRSESMKFWLDAKLLRRLKRGVSRVFPPR